MFCLLLPSYDVDAHSFQPKVLKFVNVSAGEDSLVINNYDWKSFTFTIPYNS